MHFTPFANCTERRSPRASDHSIAGAFWYNPSDNRAVAVDSVAMLEALRVVYRARNVLNELGVPDN